MAGDIKLKYVATQTVTTTNLVTACTNTATWLTGWTSNTVTNNANDYVDYLYSGQFTLAGTNAAAGYINVYVITSLNDTPTWTATSSGTLGTESATAVVFADAQRRDSIARLLCSIATSATNGGIFTFPQIGIASLFGGMVPTHHCLWVSANVNTSTNANFQATCALYYEPVLAQYT